MREVGEPVKEPECSREWPPLAWWARLPCDVLRLGEDEPETLDRLRSDRGRAIWFSDECERHRVWRARLTDSRARARPGSVRGRSSDG